MKTAWIAIASAGLAALVLFGSYVEELKAHLTRNGQHFEFQFSLTEPKVIIGLFIGGLLPFILTTTAVTPVPITMASRYNGQCPIRPMTQMPPCGARRVALNTSDSAPVTAEPTMSDGITRRGSRRRAGSAPRGSEVEM